VATRAAETNGAPSVPAALVDRRAVATWGMSRGWVTLEPFGRIMAPILADLDG